jgi:hypothetical protein
MQSLLLERLSHLQTRYTPSRHMSAQIALSQLHMLLELLGLLQ